LLNRKVRFKDNKT